jgi:hypothetical protein
MLAMVLMTSILVLVEVLYGHVIMRLRLFSGGITQKVQLRMHHLWMFLFQTATHWKLLIDWVLRCILLRGNEFSLSYWSMR